MFIYRLYNNDAYGSGGKKFFANDVVYLALPVFLALLPFEQLCRKWQ